MDFPDIGFENNQNNNEDEIEVENLCESQNNNAFAVHSNNEGYYNMGQNTEADFGGWDKNVPTTNSYQIDEEEEKRMQDRRKEEDERRAKIIQLMNDEIRIKQEYRDKAREFIENFESTRRRNLEKRQEFNRSNETEFLENRRAVKEGKKNPWEKVVENIEIKESDYKGTKDISRMRTCILTRKGDMMKMK